MQVYSTSLRQAPSKASILKYMRAYRSIVKAIANANTDFGTGEAENVANSIIYIVVILAVGGFIVTYLLGILGQAMPSISQSNPLYNATTNVLHGMLSLGTLFTSGVNLIAILILITVVSAIIMLVRSGFGSGRGGTGT